MGEKRRTPGFSGKSRGERLDAENAAQVPAHVAVRRPRKAHGSAPRPVCCAAEDRRRGTAGPGPGGERAAAVGSCASGPGRTCSRARGPGGGTATSVSADLGREGGWTRRGRPWGGHFCAASAQRRPLHPSDRPRLRRPRPCSALTFLFFASRVQVRGDTGRARRPGPARICDQPRLSPPPLRGRSRRRLCLSSWVPQTAVGKLCSPNATKSPSDHTRYTVRSARSRTSRGPRVGAWDASPLRLLLPAPSPLREAPRLARISCAPFPASPHPSPSGALVRPGALAAVSALGLRSWAPGPFCCHRCSLKC